MSEVTEIQEGEEVVINMNRYKRVGDKLVNMTNPNDTMDIGGNGASMMSLMIEKLGIMNG